MWMKSLPRKRKKNPHSITITLTAQKCDCLRFQANGLRKYCPLCNGLHWGICNAFTLPLLPLLSGNVILVPKQLCPFITWLLRVWSMDQHSARDCLNAESQATFTLAKSEAMLQQDGRVLPAHSWLHSVGLEPLRLQVLQL